MKCRLTFHGSAVYFFSRSRNKQIRDKLNTILLDFGERITFDNSLMYYNAVFRLSHHSYVGVVSFSVSGEYKLSSLGLCPKRYAYNGHELIVQYFGS